MAFARNATRSVALAAAFAVAALAHGAATAGAAPAPPVPTTTGWSALANDGTHTMTVWHGRTVARVMPISLGSRAHPTPNGVYRTMEKFRSMVMDSSTFGVPVDSPEGYRTRVDYATRLSWDGIFIHDAPWSVQQQGRTNVSHGCINVGRDNARFVYENLPIGTPVKVVGTIGGTYTGS